MCTCAFSLASPGVLGVRMRMSSRRACKAQRMGHTCSIKDHLGVDHRRPQATKLIGLGLAHGSKQQPMLSLCAKGVHNTREHGAFWTSFEQDMLPASISCMGCKHLHGLQASPAWAASRCQGICAQILHGPRALELWGAQAAGQKHHLLLKRPKLKPRATGAIPYMHMQYPQCL